MYSENTHFDNNNNSSTTHHRSFNKRLFVSTSIGIGGVVILILLILAFGRFLSGSNAVTFSAFLEWISSFQPIFVDNTYINYSILNDWGIMNGFRDFLNIFTNIFSVIVYVFKSLINVLSYLLNIVRFLFV